MSQRYVSNELTHFVGRSLRTDERYKLLVEILKTERLLHPLHKTAFDARLVCHPKKRISQNDTFQGTYVCFCDIPVADLEIHMSKYGRFGLSFAKCFLVRKGASPVFYVAQASKVARLGDTRAKAFDAKFGLYQDLMTSNAITPDVWERLNELGLFLEWEVFSRLKFFDHNKSELDDDNYYLEREWRVLGKVDFALSDVCRVIIPKTYAQQLRSDVPDYYGQLTFADLSESLPKPRSHGASVR